MECIQPKICNCLKNCQCDDGYSCCSEKNQNGAKPTFGMCVKQGFCDEKRGIPMKNCRDSAYKQKSTNEEYIQESGVREGYNDDCDCKNWNDAMITMVIIIVLMVFLGIIMYGKK